MSELNNSSLRDLIAMVLDQAATSLRVKISDGTDSLLIDSDGSLQSRVVSSALPSGASTAANQSTEITSLASIDGKLVAESGAADAVVASLNGTITKARGMLFNGSTWDRMRSVVTGLNQAATGIIATVNSGLYESSPTTRTVNTFSAFLQTIRGSLATSLYDPQTDRYARVTPFRALHVEDTYRLLGGNFTGATLDTQRWNSAVTGVGTVALVSNGLATMSSGASTTSSSVLNSINVARFLSGTSNFWLSGVRLGDLGIAGNVRRWGVFDANNGLFFQLDGTTLGIVSRTATVDTVVTTFNGINAFTLDTNFRTYEIHYVAGTANFIVDGKVIHTITTTTLPLTAAYDFPIRYENTNTSNSTNVTLLVRGTSVNRYGNIHSRPLFHNVVAVAETRTLKRGAGTLHRVMVNSRGSGSTTIILYDSTGAATNPIATIDIVNNLGPQDFMIDFNNGLTYVTSAANGNVTCIFD